MTTDPTSLPGSIAGPGGPYDPNSVVVDASNAVLLDSIEVCTVERTLRQRPGGRPVPADAAPTQAVAMVLSGRVNRRQERANVLFVFDEDGAASIITELIALYARLPDDAGKPFVEAMMARFDTLRAEGSMP